MLATSDALLHIGDACWPWQANSNGAAAVKERRLTPTRLEFLLISEGSEQ